MGSSPARRLGCLADRRRLLASCDNGTEGWLSLEKRLLGDLPHIPFFGFRLPLLSLGTGNELPEAEGPVRRPVPQS